jgi:HK97 family phage portal protein
MKRFRPRSQKRSTQIVQVGAGQWDEMLETGMGYTRLSDNPDVKGAVNTIAELVSSMSIHLLESTDKGNKRVSNELSHLIDVNPSSGMIRKTWLTKIVRDLFLYGDGNSLCQIIVQPGSKYLTELRPLDMSNVSYWFDSVSNELEVRYNGEVMDTSQLVHFLINPDPKYPLIGHGFDADLRMTLQNLSQAGKTRNTFMSGRFMPNVILRVDSDSESASGDLGRQKIRDKYLGHNDGLEPWIIPSDLLEVQQVKPLTLEDIALKDGVDMDKQTIANLFGVPASLLGVGEFKREEYNNFVNTKVAGIGQVIAQTLTRDVLYSDKLFFQFNPRSLYQYDLAELINAGKEMSDRSAIDRNEWRGWVGLEPREDMEELITLENYIPTESLGAQKKLTDSTTLGGGDENDTTNATHGSDPQS